MKRICILLLAVSCLLFEPACAQSNSLRLVFIRHAEKSEDGENLTCKGFNRSVMLPAVLYKKFGVPAAIYVPSLSAGEKTKHARMFQTISPFAIKYNLAINSEYDESDYKDVGKALLNEKGTIVVVWEHKSILPIINYLHVKAGLLYWPDDDFESIWIVTFKNGRAILAKDREGLSPSDKCSF